MNKRSQHENLTINVLDIRRGTTVDGPGFRTSIYLAGCRHGCPGCQNPDSWDFSGGTHSDIDSLMEVIQEEDFNVTLSGGDPLYHPDFIINLCREIRETGHSIWIYTGFKWKEILNTPEFSDLLSLAEVIVDGPFISALHDPDLLFRGSSNQRLIHVVSTIRALPATLPSNCNFI